MVGTSNKSLYLASQVLAISSKRRGAALVVVVLGIQTLREDHVQDL